MPIKTSHLQCYSPEGFHRVAYNEWGVSNPDHPTVICAHGVARNSHDFDALAHYLSQRRRHVVCPDIVGRGDSDWFKHPQYYTFEQYIADMTALIARTSVNQIDWIGTSMGGLIGMMMAALPNSAIRCLILNDVGPQVSVQGLHRLAKYIDKHPTFANKKEAKQYFKTTYADFGKLTESQWDEFTEHSIKLDADKRYALKYDPRITHSKNTAHFVWGLMFHPHKTLEGIFFDIDFWPIWQQIKCPVLIIHGRHSDILLPNIIDKMQKTHAQTSLLQIEDAGHAPALLHIKEHEKINHWLDTFDLV